VVERGVDVQQRALSEQVCRAEEPRLQSQLEQHRDDNQ